MSVIPDDSAQQGALRFRLNLAAGQLGDAAKDALELAQFEQVGTLLDCDGFTTLEKLCGLKNRGLCAARCAALQAQLGCGAAG